MFRGVSGVSLDDKGRMAVPVRYRSVFTDTCGGELVLTIDTECPCLLIYSVPVWEALQKEIEALPGFMPEVRRIQRLLIGHATDVVIDGSGRILVPALLRNYAGLSKSAVLLGQGEKLELWDEQSWNDQCSAYLAEGRISTEIPEVLKKLSL